MSSKPPLGGRVGTLCTAELGVDDPIVAKVVLTGDCTSLRGLKITDALVTVSVQSDFLYYTLPERYREMEAPVSPDVDVFHLLTRTFTFKIKDVKVLEVSTEVVSEIDAVGRVAACCSPVGRVVLQGFSSDQIQAVEIPVQGVLVHWIVVPERILEKRGKLAISNTPRHDQCPCSTRLRCQITVSWVTVSFIVIKPVHAAFGGTSQQIIKTRGWTGAE